MSSSKGKRKALGRGLEAILQSPETDITAVDISGNYVAGAIADLDISKIESNPFQPRSDFDEILLKELADSITVQGVIQPVTVRKLGFEKYQLIAGERRIRASKLAGIDRIPAYIRVANDEQMLEMALIENIHRQDLNAIEVAISYTRLIDECKLTQEKLSERLGKNRSTIANFLRLLKLPPEVQIALRDDVISMGHARALITIKEEETQMKILKKIIVEGLNVRQIEEIVRQLSSTKTVKEKNTTKASLPIKYKQTPAELSLKFSSKVSLKRNNNGNGNIVISFNNDEDLDRILNIIK